MRRQAGESDKDLALRRMLRIKNGRVSRNPATNRIDNNSAMVQRPRKPSMPKMPWDEARREVTACLLEYEDASIELNDLQREIKKLK
jgi:hypothetical protein